MANPNIKNFYLPVTRKHVTRGSDWGQVVGTDYWLAFNSGFDILAAASTGTDIELAEAGWTSTSMVNTAGSTSDFGGGVFTKSTTAFKKSAPFDGSYGDAGTPNHALTNATGDILISPAIFGDAAHMEMAAIIMGKNTIPRYLIADFWAAFTVASADEGQTAVGFFEDGATASVAADQYAAVYSDGTNFQLAGNGSDLDAGPAISTTWHKWKIVIERDGSAVPKIYWFVDGAIQNTTAVSGISDEFPLKFGLHSLTTNRIGLGLTHIYYDY